MTHFKIENYKSLFLELIGSFLVAIGIYNFALPAAFPMTGFSGIAIILYRIFRFPVGISTIVLNIPVSLFCYRRLGKPFFLRSIRCMIISSLMTDFIAPFFPVYHGSRLLAAMCTGILAGFGYAIIYMQYSSTGGMDFITMTIKSMKPHLPLGRIVFFADAVIILLGGFIFRDMDGIIYGMIVSYLFGIMVDKTMYGANAGKFTLIVTSLPQLITETITQCCNRGSTILSGYGGYRNDERYVVLCACSPKEMYILQKAVKEADPASFLVILESSEVHGEGFHPLMLGEKEE